MGVSASNLLAELLGVVGADLIDRQHDRAALDLNDPVGVADVEVTAQDQRLAVVGVELDGLDVLGAVELIPDAAGEEVLVDPLPVSAELLGSVVPLHLLEVVRRKVRVIVAAHPDELPAGDGLGFITAEHLVVEAEAFRRAGHDLLPDLPCSDPAKDLLVGLERLGGLYGVHLIPDGPCPIHADDPAVVLEAAGDDDGGDATGQVQGVLWGVAAPVEVVRDGEAI